MSLLDFDASMIQCPRANAIRVRALFVVLVAVAAVVLLMGALPAFAINPHGQYSSGSESCKSCHSLHTAAGDPITNEATQKELCYSCHDGSASAHNVRAGFGESVPGTTTAKSFHPVPSGAIKCLDCHTAHKGPAEGNPSSLSAGSAEATGGVAVCGACHGPGSTLSGGNLAGPIAGTPHASLASSASPAGIACVACHEPHASSNADLVRSRLRTESQTTVTVSGEPGLCLGCHQDSGGVYDGAKAAAAQKHSTVTSSTKALTSWPGASGTAGGCDGCHEPHGAAVGPSYTRADDEELCRTCHDDASVSYPTNYSYRGTGTFSASGHGGITPPAIDYVSLLAEGPSFTAWESTTPPTPSNPGTLVSAARASALLTAEGTRLTTSLQVTNGDWDYQTYRFKLPVATADLTSIRVNWAGYGEEAPGFPVTLSAWKPGTSSWELIQSAQMVTQQTVNVALSTANHVTADGYVYLVAKARYSQDEVPISGPTVTALSGTSARVNWVTSGLTSSHIDYGTTTSYTNTTGDATRTQSHEVTVTGLSPGAWHFRARSTALDGSSYTSADIVQGIPGPTVVAMGTASWTGTPITRVFNWNAPAGAPGPFEYRFHLQNGSTPIIDTDWGSSTSYTTALDNGTYNWRVEARDGNGVRYGYSAWNTFWHFDNSGTCPYLFTWDGEKFAFEADLYGPGKLALKTKTGYAKPTPDDVYILANEPALVGGRIDLRLVEERYETDYLDEMRLYALDVPADRDVYAEKREAGGASFSGVAGELHTVSKNLESPRSVVHINSGQDIRGLVAANDGEYAVLNTDRNAGFTYQTLELDLGDIAAAPQVKIVMDALSMYPSNNEGAALAGTFGARTKLEVQDAEGLWVAVPTATVTLPKPPEFSRPYVFDVSNIWVSDSRKVRFTFLFKTYVDWIAVDTTADLPVTITEAPLESAELLARGFDPQSSDDEIFEYVYGEPTNDLSYLPGAYTKFGEVADLLGDTDDRFVIYGGGDEVQAKFIPPDQADFGTTRRWAIHTNGYYKDLKTDVTPTVEPLPFAAMSNFPYGPGESYPTDSAHVDYRAGWNTRVEGVSNATPVMSASEEGVLQAGWIRFTSFVDRGWDKVVALVTPTAGGNDSVASVALHRSLNTDLVGLEVTAIGASSGNTCSACHAPHGGTDSGAVLAGGRAAADGRTCTADGTGGCHDNAANSASGIDIRTAFTTGADPRARHDVMPSDQQASGGRTACADCHNPHRDNADVRFADPDNMSQTTTSPLTDVVATDGSVWALVGASHDGRAPDITSIALSASPSTPSSPTVTWQTLNESSTSWVDWGTTVAYELGNESSGSPFGTSTPVISHSVQMSSLATGTLYHYRVRSTDALGNTSVSADRTYTPIGAPPAPVMSDVTTVTGAGAAVQVPVSCTSVASTDGHAVQYWFDVGGQVSGWLASPSWVGPWLYDGTYNARVMARDAVDQQAVSPWSAYDSFVVTGSPQPVESCPNLFVWDGERFAFVTDVMGLGPIGVKKGKNAYLNPEPVEDTVIPQGTLVARDGSLDIQLSDERSEIEYVDEIKLVAVDHPVGTRLLINDLHWGPFDGGREPTVYHTIADAQPVDVMYERIPVLGAETIPSTNVSAKTAVEGDGQIAYSGLYDDNIWTLDLGALDDPQSIKLVVAAWVDYANKTEKAAWLASGKRPPASYIEVQDADGAWVKVGDAPHPPGYTKTVVYDFTGVFPEGVTEYKVRIHSYMRMNIDYIGVDTAPDEAVLVTERAPRSANLAFKGVSAYVETPYPLYRYDDIVDTTPAEQEGAFTRYGDVRELLLDADDRFVIMDTGDDMAISFDEPAAPAPGSRRTYVIHTDGFHDTQSGTVDPLPFHAMSGYPYGADERYPEDTLHTSYLSIWNTRIRGSVSIAVGTELSATSVDWAEYHTSAWIPVVENEFSVDSDQFVALVEFNDGSTTTVAVDAGWESESSETVKPTPSAPGIAVGASSVASLALDDGSYWRTNLATVDTRWNWQVMKFDLSSFDLSDVQSVAFFWQGHGEPTPGYPTSVSVWNPATGAWVQVERTQMAVDISVSRRWGRLNSVFCLRCHDGTPPAGVVFPANVKYVGPTWSASDGDFHGGGSPSGWVGSALKWPYTANQPAIDCVTCHDTHGTASVYHFKSVVNGSSVPTITSGTWTPLCVTCHSGSVLDMHADCIGCHEGSWDHYGSITYLLPNETSDCSQCHGHNKSWAHQAQVCGHCHISLTYTRTF